METERSRILARAGFHADMMRALESVDRRRSEYMPFALNCAHLKTPGALEAWHALYMVQQHIDDAIDLLAGVVRAERESA
jgi:hypothetical protein